MALNFNKQQNTLLRFILYERMVMIINRGHGIIVGIMEALMETMNGPHGDKLRSNVTKNVFISDNQSVSSWK